MRGETVGMFRSLGAWIPLVCSFWHPFNGVLPIYYVGSAFTLNSWKVPSMTERRHRRDTLSAHLRSFLAFPLDRIRAPRGLVGVLGAWGLSVGWMSFLGMYSGSEDWLSVQSLWRKKVNGGTWSQQEGEGDGGGNRVRFRERDQLGQTKSNERTCGGKRLAGERARG